MGARLALGSGAHVKVVEDVLERLVGRAVGRRRGRRGALSRAVDAAERRVEARVARLQRRAHARQVDPRRGGVVDERAEVVVAPEPGDVAENVRDAAVPAAAATEARQGSGRGGTAEGERRPVGRDAADPVRCPRARSSDPPGIAIFAGLQGLALSRRELHDVVVKIAAEPAEEIPENNKEHKSD